MQSCGLDATSGALFEGVMLRSTHLRSIDFSWNKIGKEGAQAIARVLHSGAETVTHSHRANCTDVRGHSQVSRVRLMGCSLGPTGCEFMAHMLRTNRSITALHIPFNDIGPIGALPETH